MFAARKSARPGRGSMLGELALTKMRRIVSRTPAVDHAPALDRVLLDAEGRQDVAVDAGIAAGLAPAAERPRSRRPLLVPVGLDAADVARIAVPRAITVCPTGSSMNLMFSLGSKQPYWICWKIRVRSRMLRTPSSRVSRSPLRGRGRQPVALDEQGPGHSARRPGARSSRAGACGTRRCRPDARGRLHIHIRT